MKRVYLDHAAATPVDPRVAKAMRPYLSRVFGNPGAIHREGIEARDAVEGARRVIADQLGILPDEVVFTASATESAQIAIAGSVEAWRAVNPAGAVPHIIVSSIEHDAVLAQSRALEARGARVTRLPVDQDGIIDLAALAAAIDENTVVISVMYANNEIGTIEPIREVARVIRKWKKEYRGFTRDRRIAPSAHYPLLHTDATQAANYLDMHIPRLGVDLLTMNAAKIYGPKGIGLLAVRRGTPLLPITVGGGQESGRRAGTENVPAIVGFAEALRIARKLSASETRRLSALRDRAIRAIARKIPSVVLNGARVARLPNNIHITLPGIDHEYLALLLDARGFAVATKSACNEAEGELSHVLLALYGTNDRKHLEGLRVTLGRKTTHNELLRFVRVLIDAASLAAIR